MPRSQRTQLSKSPTAEAKLGTIGSEAVRTVNMPTVTAQKSMGESLAEAVGLAAKAGAGIYKMEAEKQNKATAAQHKIEGNNDGKNRALTDLEEIRKLPLLEQNAAIMAKSRAYFESLKGSSSDFSTDYFSSNVSAYRDAMDSADGKIYTAVNKEVQANNKIKASSAITAGFEQKLTAAEIISTNKDGPWTGTSAQKLDQYVEQAASYALAMQQTVPGFDTETFIKDYLEIKAPNNGPDLLKNASTGDKIRKLRADLTSDGNSVNTKMKKEYKEMTSLLSTQGATPTEYNTHVDGGVAAGVYSKIKATDLKLKYNEKVTKELVAKNITALNEEEQAYVAKLKTDATYGGKEGALYVSKETKTILVNYEKNLNKQVAANDMTHEEAIEKAEEMKAHVLKTSKHLTYLGNFHLGGSNNASKYATLPSETKAWVTDQVKSSLDQAKDLGTIVKIANANPGASKAYVSTMFPYTTDAGKIKKALESFDSLKNHDNGYDMFNKLPSKQKLYYEALDAIRDLDGNVDVSQEEAERLTKMVEAVGDTRDFRIKIKKKYKDVKTLNESIAGLPDDLQVDVLVTYDYFTQFMKPYDALQRIKSKVRPKYYKTWDIPGSTNILGLSADTVTAINWGSFTSGNKISPIAVLKAFKATGRPVEGNARLSYDERTDTFTLGKSSLDENALVQVDMYKATWAELKAATKKNKGE